MPTINRNVGVTWTQKDGVNTLFFDPLWLSMLTLNKFRVMTNIKDKKKLGFVRKLDKILQKAITCGWNPQGSMSVYDRMIEVDPVKVNLEMCVDEFKDTVIAQNFAKTGNSKYDMQGTDFLRMVMQLIQDSLPGEYQRLFWFGDKSSTDPTLNLTNGFWSVYAEDLATSNQSPYINSNSGAPLAAGAGIALLKAMHKAQSTPLKGLTNAEKVFYVTDSVYEAVLDDYESLGGGDAGRFQLINGVNTLMYRGIRIEADANWDQTMEVDLGRTDAHLALLTTPNNLIMATDMASDMNKVESWYDRKDELNYLKINSKFGTNFVHAAFFVIAY